MAEEKTSMHDILKKMQTEQKTSGNELEETSCELPTADDPAKQAELMAELDKKTNEAEQHIERLLQLEKELADTKLRLHAEVENARRRADMRVEEAHKFALGKFVKELLAVVDSIERGLESCPPSEHNQAIREGMELTYKMFLDILQKFNIEQVNPINSAFDPQKHEAIATQPNKEVPANTVLNVIQKGYMLNGRLIRPALVVVALNSN